MCDKGLVREDVLWDMCVLFVQLVLVFGIVRAHIVFPIHVYTRIDSCVEMIANPMKHYTNVH